MGVGRQSRNGDGEQVGVLRALRLGGLSTTPSSTFPFEKSKAAEAASVAEYIKYGFENWDGTQSPCSDPEHSGPMVSQGSSAIQKCPMFRALDLRAGEITWGGKKNVSSSTETKGTNTENYPRLKDK